MAYDHELADRIRELVANEDGVTEQRMFGGLAFLINGNMSVAASREGGLLVRTDPEQSGSLVDGEQVTPMFIGEREMPGWLYVDIAAVGSDGRLKEWVSRAVAFARSLPAKRKR